jgi:dipeptidyl aminopeptidase/acylaminoacyl peptidase
VRLLSIVFVAGLFATALMAQTSPVNCAGKLSESQVEKLLSAGVSQTRVEQFVRTCGIGFEVTPAAAARLRRVGAGSALIGVLRELQPKRQEPAPTPVDVKSKGFDVQALLKVVRVSEPRISLDNMVVFTVTTASGESNLYTALLNGGAPTRLTTDGMSRSPMWSPDGRNIVFLSKRGGSFQVWVMKRDGSEQTQITKSHPVVSMVVQPDGKALILRTSNRRLRRVQLDGSDIADLSTGSVHEGYAVAPDNVELCYAKSSGLYVVPLTLGLVTGAPAKQIVEGADLPRYSPDGRNLAYLMRDGADLMVLERSSGKAQIAATGIGAISSFIWSPDSTQLFFVTPDRGRTLVRRVSASGGPVRGVISGDTWFDQIQLTNDGKSLLYVGETGSRPTELFRVTSDGAQPKAMTHFNDWVSGLPAFEEIWVQGASQGRIQTLIVKPPVLAQTERYPVVVFAGGPFGFEFTYLWNPQIFVNAGYVVVIPEPKGRESDLAAIIDAVGKLPYIDASRIAQVTEPRFPSPGGKEIAAWYQSVLDWLKAAKTTGGGKLD